MVRLKHKADKLPDAKEILQLILKQVPAKRKKKFQQHMNDFLRLELKARLQLVVYLIAQVKIGFLTHDEEKIAFFAAKLSSGDISNIISIGQDVQKAKEYITMLLSAVPKKKKLQIQELFEQYRVVYHATKKEIQALNI